MDSHGALDVQAHPCLVANPNRVLAKTSWEIEISAIRRLSRPWSDFFIFQRVALPLSLTALFLLIYDKLDLVFLSRSLLLAAPAHTSPPPAFSTILEP